MATKVTETFTATIYLSGSIAVIKQVCREYCFKIGLCVTVNECLFIYTGGEEFGVEIGLINYPRFPDTKENITEKALELAHRCREAAHQHSFLIITPEKTLWDSNRKES